MFSNNDICALPAGVSAHTESVHFSKLDEEHFYLKETKADLKQQQQQKKFIYNPRFAYMHI